MSTTKKILPPARADLHVHSRYSDQPTEWLLRRLGAPESFTEPRKVYERAKAAGMDFVTISDHDCIRGALEIAHLPGVFLSSEVTTSFPEDGCPIHLLVLGVTESRVCQILGEATVRLRAMLDDTASSPERPTSHSASPKRAGRG